MAYTFFSHVHLRTLVTVEMMGVDHLELVNYVIPMDWETGGMGMRQKRVHKTRYIV